MLLKSLTVINKAKQSYNTKGDTYCSFCKSKGHITLRHFPSIGDILKNLIDCVTKVRIAICVRRSVV